MIDELDECTWDLCIEGKAINLMRPWINDLEDYLPAWKREELKRQNEADGYQMVSKYEDCQGRSRVQGS